MSARKQQKQAKEEKDIEMEGSDNDEREDDVNKANEHLQSRPRL